MGLYVYWCPRCGRQSDRPTHRCDKGPPLIPQLDVVTSCEVLKVVRTEQYDALRRALVAAKGHLAGATKLPYQAATALAVIAIALDLDASLDETVTLSASDLAALSTIEPKGHDD